MKTNKHILVLASLPVLLADCGISSVSEGHPLLPPHSRTRIVARIAADSPGGFVKYVFVQPDDSDFYITLKITGNVR